MKLKYQLRGLGIGMIVTAILMGVATGHAIPLTDAEIKARALELGMVEGGSLKLTDLEGMSAPTSRPGEESNVGGQGSGEREENQGSDKADAQGGAQGSSEADGAGAESVQPGSEGAEEGSEGAGTDKTNTSVSGESKTQEPETVGAGIGASGESGTAGAGTNASGDSKTQEPGTAGYGESDGAEPGIDSSGESGEAGSHVVRDGDVVSIVIEPGTDSYAISKTLAEAGLVEDAGEFDRFLCDNLYSRKIVDGTYEIPAGTGEEEIAKIITRDR